MSVPSTGHVNGDGDRAALASDARSSDYASPASGAPSVLPASFAQQRLWLIEQMEPGTAVYNVPVAFRLTGDFRPGALEASMRAIARRHESLRTTFAERAGALAQLVWPEPRFALATVDVSHLGGDERESETSRLVRKAAAHSFDLVDGPLLCVTLIRLAAHEHVLVLVVHHLVADGGWSMELLLRELGMQYEAALDGRSAVLPALAVQYADFAAWQRERADDPDVQRQLDYWREHLADAPTTSGIPTDRPRSLSPSHAGGRHAVRLAAPLVRALRQRAAEAHATLPTVLLAAWCLLLARYGDDEDVVVGMPIAGRTRPETEPLIGLFINTLVVRAALHGDPTGREVLRRIRDEMLTAYANQDVPFDRIVETLRPHRSASRMPLVQIAFAPQRLPREPLALPGVAVLPFDVDSGAAVFDLTLFAHESDDPDDVRLVLDYRAALYDEPTIERALAALLRLLHGFAADVDGPVSAYSLLDAHEREQLLLTWSETAHTELPVGPVPERFAAIARETPNATAVEQGAVRMTYDALERRSNQLARHLRSHGVARGTLVGLAAERSPATVAAMLGILKAGGAYVPLDPTYPDERLQFMIADARLDLLIVDTPTRERFAAFPATLVHLEDDDPSISRHSDTALESQGLANDLAYVMYTSGSTGAPNGVEITHRGVLRLVVGVDYVPLDSERRILHLAPSAFDASTFELWGPLLNGGCVVLAPNAPPSARLLREVISRGRVDTAWLTASLFNAIVDEDVSALAGLRWLLIGGEALSVHHVRRALNGLAQTTLVNGYGPTESTTFTCCATISRHVLEGATSIPIGRPIANTRVYVLDRRGEPVPIGVPGELYIGGAGLARGYLNRPSLTAARFVEASWRDRERVYLTGDRVRWRSDGMLEFLGRADEQVKLRGYRIELAEIEAVLAGDAEVRECVVALRDDPPAGKRLVAYVVLGGESHDSSGAGISPRLSERLRRLLRVRLPEYMVPSTFVALSSLPLTASGKIDRRALPPPPHDAGTDARISGPRTEIERRLQEIWTRVVGVADVGVDVSFFDIGGHSLLLVRLAHEIREQLGRDIPLAVLFQASTIAALASLLERENEVRAWSPLVALRSTGTRAPLYLVHEGGGNIVRLHLLATHLDANRPVYGLQALGLNGSQRPHDRIEDMAAFYIEAIRGVQPSGPYHLGGASFGGVVAFEMALRLAEAGEEVALLALFDSSLHPRHMVSRTAWLRFQLSRLALHTRNLLFERRRGAYVIDHARGLRRSVRDWLGARMHEGGEDAAAFVPSAYADVWEAARKAYHDYVPRAYAGRVTLFRALTREPGCPRDPAPDWRRWCSGGLEVIDVPGGHSTIFKEPHVAMLARRLADSLSRAGADGAP